MRKKIRLFIAALVLLAAGTGLTACVKTVIYTVSFETNGGSPVAAITAEKGQSLTLPETIKCGFVFDGWFDNEQLTGNPIAFPYTPASDIKLYAKFTEIFKVTFKSGQETLDSREIKGGDRAERPANDPVKESTQQFDFAFENWYSDSACTQIFDFAGTPINGNVTIYARFTETVRNYTVSFLLDGEPYGEAQTVPYGGKAVLPQSPRKDATAQYTFAFSGWFESESAETAYDFSKQTVTSNVSLQARFTKALNSYTVTFISQGATHDKQTVNYGSKIDKPADPSKASVGQMDYPFSGWYTDIRLTRPYDFQTQTMTGELTLYAGFEETDRLVEYSLTGNGYTVTGVKNKDASGIIVPAAYRGLPVTAVKRGAFADCPSLSVLTLPFVGEKKDGSGATYFGYIFDSDGVNNNSSVPRLEQVAVTGGTAVNDSAFRGCAGIKSIVLPDSIVKIGNYAFEDCSALTGISIPGNADAIGSFAFRRCNSLTEIIIPDSVKTIGHGAFVSCGSAESLTLPKGAVTFGEAAFSGCASLKTVTIPRGVTYLSNNLFAACLFLNSVTIPDTVESIGSKAFINCERLTSVVLPRTLKSVGSYAFSYCTQLTSAVIPDGIKEIPSHLFDGCANLNSVTIPDTVESIGSKAFIGCERLTSVVLPRTLKSVGSYAFSNCTQLTSVVIPAGIKEIPSHLFDGCANLNSVTIEEGITAIGSSAFEGCTKLETINFPDSLRTISDYAFNSCRKLASVVMKGVASIGPKSFYSCTGLINLTIGDSATDIAITAFEGCNAIQSLTCPAGAVGLVSKTNLSKATITSGEIAPAAFAACLNLTDLTVSDSVTAVASNAFDNCPNIQNLACPAFAVQFFPKDSLENVTVTSGTAIADDSFKNSVNLKSVILLDGIESIGPSAFSGCTALTEVNLPDSVTVIGAYAFKGCAGLNTVTIGRGEKAFGSHAFLDCNALKEVYYTGGLSGWCDISFADVYANPLSYAPELYIDKALLTKLVISDGTVIGNYSFAKYLALTEAEIQSQGTAIPAYAFYGCTNLRRVNVTGSIGSIEEYSFYGCGGLTEISFPDGLTVIGQSAFSECTALSSVTIPGTVELIGGGAFRNCGLISVVIKSGVREIGQTSFFNCTKLSRVTIHAGVTKIGVDAFRHCTGLVKLSIPDSVTTIEASAFDNCPNIETLICSSFAAGFIQKTNLKKLTVTSGEIAAGALSDCAGLTDLTVSDSVTAIASNAFDNCPNIQNLACPAFAVQFIPKDSLENVTVTSGEIAANQFLDCAGLTSVTLMRDVTSIGDRAFQNCTYLKEFNMVGPKNFGFYVFGGCNITDVYFEGGAAGWLANKFSDPSSTPLNAASNLYLDGGLVTELVVPEGVIKIGNYAFYDYKQLTKITFADSVDMIESNAFVLSGLKSVFIPAGITSISPGAFIGCDLSSIEVSPENLIHHSDGNCLINTQNKSLVVGCKNSVIPDDGSVTSIGLYAFNQCAGLTAIVIPQGVTDIAAMAFRDCKNLTNVTVAGSVKNIKSYAFNGCEALTAITFEGTTEQWQAVIKEDGWDGGTGEYTVTCTDGTVNKTPAA